MINLTVNRLSADCSPMLSESKWRQRETEHTVPWTLRACTWRNTGTFLIQNRLPSIIVVNCWIHHPCACWTEGSENGSLLSVNWHLSPEMFNTECVRRPLSTHLKRIYVYIFKQWTLCSCRWSGNIGLSAEGFHAQDWQMEVYHFDPLYLDFEKAGLGLWKPVICEEFSDMVRPENAQFQIITRWR